MYRESIPFVNITDFQLYVEILVFIPPGYIFVKQSNGKIQKKYIMHRRAHTFRNKICFVLKSPETIESDKKTQNSMFTDTT